MKSESFQANGKGNHYRLFQHLNGQPHFEIRVEWRKNNAGVSAAAHHRLARLGGRPFHGGGNDPSSQ
jgi:hypothetical protein